MENLAFLVEVCFTAYLVLLWLRILLPTVHATYHNPISQFVIRATNPFIRPLRFFIPYHDVVDVAGIIVLLVFGLLKQYLYFFVLGNILLPWFDAAILTAGSLLQILLMIFFWALIIQSLLSWVGSEHRSYGQLQNILHHLTAWMLNPMRRLVPPVGVVDFAAVPLLIILYLLFHLVGAYTFGFINI